MQTSSSHDIDGFHEEAQSTQQYAHLSPEQLTSSILSRSSSNTSSLGNNSPARPPKSERRQSSTSQEVMQYTSALYTSPRPDKNEDSNTTSTRPALLSSSSSNRSSRVSNLSLTTSPPLLSSVNAGSTPISPNLNISNVIPSPIIYSTETRSPSLQRQGSTSTAELLASTLDSYHLEGSRDHTSASSSLYSNSVPPSPASGRPISPPPVSAFTAGQDHALLPTLGAFKIESTTGSKSTVIKPPKKKKKQQQPGTAENRSPYSGGISSEDIFGSTTDSTDDPTSDTGSRSSGRARGFSLSSRKGRKSEALQSSEAVPDAEPLSPTSPGSPDSGSISRMSGLLSGLRRRASRSESQASSISESIRSVSRASSRRSLSNVSISASGSEPDQEGSGQSHERRRSRRLSKLSKGKSASAKAEEEEHLRILAELRLKALSLASADDPVEGSTSTGANRAEDRYNAELLIRDMERQRLSRRNTDSTSYSGVEDYANDDTITSPISLSHKRSDSWTRENTSLLPNSLLTSPSRPHADVPLDEDDSDEFSARKSFVDIGRRATLMPSSSHSSLNGSQAQPRFSGQRRRTSSTKSSVPSSYGDVEDRHLLDAMLSNDARRNTIVPGRPAFASEEKTPSPTSSSFRGGSGKIPRRASIDLRRARQGSEADIEDVDGALVSSILERRRSTVKSDQTILHHASGPRTSRKYSQHSRPGSQDGPKATPVGNRSSRGSSEDLKNEVAIRSRNQSISSSRSAKSGAAEVIAPPVRSSSRPDIATAASPEQGLHSPRGTHPYGARHAREAADTSGQGFMAVIESSRLGGNVVSSNTRPSVTVIGTSTQGAAEPTVPATASQHQIPTTGGGLHSLRDRPAHHRRSSSDAQTYLEQQRQKPFLGHHRRTSSNDSINKALPARPLSERNPQIPSGHVSQQQRQQDQYLTRLAASVKRNKPLPQAYFVKDELRSSRSSGERAVIYAHKINELAQEESGLLAWLLFTRPNPTAADSTIRQTRRTSMAPSAWSATYYAQTHLTRDDTASEAVFPLRKGSQDMYKARDITQRAPSVAPSTMVPNNIPYPGVYEDSSTLRTTSSLSQYATLPSRSPHQPSTLASVALTAAGLPSKVGFFGLGRKGSKRAASSRHRRTDGLSISSPIRPPSPSQALASSRAMPQRPSGPRPSISSLSSEREALPSGYQPNVLPASGSFRSLAAIPQGALPNSPGSSHEVKPPVSPLAYGAATLNGADALTAMGDVLPHVSQETLVKYLTACNGDHLAAIGAYFEDERR